MVDTKKALVEADGDIEKAIEILRLKGPKGNAKRADRSTSEGLVTGTASDGYATLIELACETDFVAKNEKFIALADKVLTPSPPPAPPPSMTALAAPAGSQTVADAHRRRGRHPRREGRAAPRRARSPARTSRSTCTRPARTCRRRSVSSSPTPATTRETARSIAQHISFANPNYLTRDDVPGRRVENERRIVTEISRNEGKPEAALPKIVEGRVERVLQAGRPARAGLRQGQQADSRARCWRMRDSPCPASPASRSARNTTMKVRIVNDPEPFLCPVGVSTTNGRDHRRTSDAVLLKLSGEAFGGGQLGVNPDVVSSIAREIAQAAEDVEIAIVVGGGNFFRGAELSPARHGPRPRRLHGHARHRDERARAAGLPRAGGRRDPRAVRDLDDPGRRAVHPAPRRASPGEGPRRHLRRRRRTAVLLHRHRRRPARARDRAPTWCSSPRTASTACTTTTRAPIPDAARSTRSPTSEALAAGPQGGRLDRVQPVHGQRDADAASSACEPAGNVTKAILGAEIGTLVG